MRRTAISLRSDVRRIAISVVVTTNLSIAIALRSTLPRCRPMPLLHGELVEKNPLAKYSLIDSFEIGEAGRHRFIGHVLRNGLNQHLIPTHSEPVDLFGTVVSAHVLGLGELHAD